MGLEDIGQMLSAWKESRRHRVRPSFETVLVIFGLLGLFFFAALKIRDASVLSAYISTLVPVATLVVLMFWHLDLLTEQANMRRLQTRPQVLVYFDRKSPGKGDPERLVLVIKHFGGGPALDVQFTFEPRLVNHEGTDFQEDPPLSTGIAVMPPGYYHEMDFGEFYQFHDRAGLTRIASDVIGVDIEPTRLTFEATVSLRDPIGDDLRHKTSYRLDLSHLMPYTMIDD